MDQLMPDTAGGEAAQSAQRKRTGPRTTTACNRCRKKRGRCDGQKPICGPCLKADESCEYELGTDRRKPYAKSVVQAMQLRIDTLEAQLAALTGEGSGSAAPHVEPSGTSHAQSGPYESRLPRSTASRSPDWSAQSGSLPFGHEPFGGRSHGGADGESGDPQRERNGSRPGTGSQSSQSGSDPLGFSGTSARSANAAGVDAQDNEMDRFRGGLALNAHGELRFYGPTSSYRSVLVSAPPTMDEVTSPAATLQALRSYSLTRAPIPTAAPSEPVFPTRPPELSPDLTARLFRLAFEYGFAHYNLVPERQFYQDLQMYPLERTNFYSPFLMHVVLAVGCRYLEPDEPYPPEICGLYGDPDTRGDIFVNWARFLLDQEWYNPSMSTIRGLLVLGLYMAGRGFDGPCQIFVGLALKLTEDFGLNLGPHRLAHLPGVSIPQEVFSSRCDCFWSVFASDCVSSLYIGRRATFTPDVIDIAVPTVVPELDYDNPLYRSSAFSWSSRLMVLAGRVLHEVYSPNASRTAQQRQALVPELHLKLESWHHELPSYLRAKGTDPTKAPHAHILALNMTYHFVHIALHRPFYRQESTSNHVKEEGSEDISTEKCMAAAANIVRLIKLLKGSAGLARSALGVQLSAFSAGTVLALAAFPNTGANGGGTDRPQDSERRNQAKKDLSFLIEALKEIGTTWTTALTSAGVLDAIMIACQANEGSTVPYMPTPPLTDSSAPVPLPDLSVPVPPVPSAFQALLNPPRQPDDGSLPLVPPRAAVDPLEQFTYGLGLTGSSADSSRATSERGLPQW